MLEIRYSLRQILRDASAIASAGKRVDISDLETSFLMKWNPDSQKKILQKGLKYAKISTVPHPDSYDASPDAFPGKASPEEAFLVPAIPQFFHNKNHDKLLKKMKKHFLLKHHLLLIGPQGTGKNVLADQFCQTYSLPREYIQLHRDTSLSSLTSRAILNEKGVLEYEGISSQDSPKRNFIDICFRFSCLKSNPIWKGLGCG